MVLLLKIEKGKKKKEVVIMMGKIEEVWLRLLPTAGTLLL